MKKLAAFLMMLMLLGAMAAPAAGQNQARDSQEYPGIELKLSAKKLLNDMIPPESKQYTFNLYTVDEKPVQGGSFSLSKYVSEATLLERAKNVRADIDFSTVLYYTHQDVYDDNNGKEFYFLINEKRPDEKGLMHDTSVFLITVRIHAVAGDDNTAGSLVPEIECQRIEKYGALNQKATADAQSRYEQASGKTLGVPMAVFCNNRMGDLPMTGDNSKTVLYAILLAMSMSIMLTLSLTRRGQF